MIMKTYGGPLGFEWCGYDPPIVLSARKTSHLLSLFPDQMKSPRRQLFPEFEVDPLFPTIFQGVLWLSEARLPRMKSQRYRRVQERQIQILKNLSELASHPRVLQAVEPVPGSGLCRRVTEPADPWFPTMSLNLSSNPELPVIKVGL